MTTTAPFDEATLSAHFRRAAERLAAGGEDVDIDDLIERTLDRLRRLQRDAGKTCNACRKFLPTTAYGMDSARSDGLQRICTPCRTAKRHAREERAASEAAAIRPSVLPPLID